MAKSLQWQSLGQIFCPDQQPILGKTMTFSQSPQALVLEDRVRIYFTCRESDSPGNFISRPAFADFDRKLECMLGVSQNPLLDEAPLGAFDEHGIFPFSPARIGDRLLAYTTGWSRRVSVSVETGVGVVESHDNGQTYTRLGPGPVLSSSLHEPYLVGDAFVREYQGQVHMWYMFGTQWQRCEQSSQAERTYKIGHAISSDGINWQKNEAQQILADVLGPQESQALPSVLQHNGYYHMVFCYRHSTDFRHNPDRGYRLGYAWSQDLHVWHRNDALLNLHADEDWNNSMQCYPNLFACDGQVYLLYSGNQFGRTGFGAARLLEVHSDG